MNGFKVTIIALCYNHGKFVTEALRSVLSQSLRDVQVIVIDDASKDNSVAEIQKALRDFPDVSFIRNTENLGNCRSFNQGLLLAKGKYVVDFATDDVMLPGMLEHMFLEFETKVDSCGLLFADAELINENGRVQRTHFKRDASQKLLSKIPEGDVYIPLIRHSFLAPPAVMFRRDILIETGGYDESLNFEDFDIWIRIARNFEFAFLDEIVVKKRILKNALSSSFYRKQNSLQSSVFRVCLKIKWLNKSLDEDRALAVRLKNELRQAFFSCNFTLAEEYFFFLKELGFVSSKDYFFRMLTLLNVDLHCFYRLYVKLRHHL